MLQHYSFLTSEKKQHNLHWLEPKLTSSTKILRSTPKILSTQVTGAPTFSNDCTTLFPNSNHLSPIRRNHNPKQTQITCSQNVFISHHGIISVILCNRVNWQRILQYGGIFLSSRNKFLYWKYFGERERWRSDADLHVCINLNEFSKILKHVYHTNIVSSLQKSKQSSAAFRNLMHNNECHIFVGMRTLSSHQKKVFKMSYFVAFALHTAARVTL